MRSSNGNMAPPNTGWAKERDHTRLAAQRLSGSDDDGNARAMTASCRRRVRTFAPFHVASTSLSSLSDKVATFCGQCSKARGRLSKYARNSAERGRVRCQSSAAGSATKAASSESSPPGGGPVTWFAPSPAARPSNSSWPAVESNFASGMERTTSPARTDSCKYIPRLRFRLAASVDSPAGAAAAAAMRTSGRPLTRAPPSSTTSLRSCAALAARASRTPSGSPQAVPTPATAS
mmetsp:Transcript_113111/g.320107  ORF Transcript_113111/g.320107 Transcript_113111/m.320107 type:complete len:234 (-) Transcript_113111:165-866(-)